MAEFIGKVAVVTGGTGGIGGAICKAFAAAGAQVIATGWGEPELAARREDKEFAGIAIHALDVGDAAAVQKFAAGIARCDYLINCAGVLIRGADAFSEQAFTRSFDINVLGTVRTCEAFMPHLERSASAAIVNTASMNSIFGSGTAPSYAASKGAVALATKSMAIAWARKSIRVNAVAPGFIDTPMSAGVRSSPEFYDRISQRTPMGRWGEPHHIAGPVLFLCSTAAAWVTGVILPVDGGYSIA